MRKDLNELKAALEIEAKTRLAARVRRLEVLSETEPDLFSLVADVMLRRSEEQESEGVGLPVVLKSKELQKHRRVTEPPPVTQVTPGKAKQKPLPRPVRKSEAVEDALVSLIEILRKYPDGRRTEDLKNEANLDKVLYRDAILLGKESDQIIQRGTKRGTIYILPAFVSSAKAFAEGRVFRRQSGGAGS